MGVPVLILGESGTGREIVARTIHENSKRNCRPLISSRVCPRPTEFLESERLEMNVEPSLGNNTKTRKFRGRRRRHDLSK
jgi:DNA-binding NtrC family response regulator